MRSSNRIRQSLSAKILASRLLICGALLSFAALTSESATRSGSLHTATAIHSQFAIADFDGDQLPDFATVQMGKMTGSAAHYFIQIELSRGTLQTVSLVAPLGGLEIILRDVNGDQALDLVVSAQWLKGPVAVLLNDGHGNFTVAAPGIYPSVAWDQAFHCTDSFEEIRDCAALPTLRTGFGKTAETGKLQAPRQSLERISLEEIRRPAVLATSSRFGRSPPSQLLET